MDSRITGEGITFDDILLVPGFSEILGGQADVKTLLSRNVPLNVPIVSAAMDTVTESALAISLAQQGGIGIIHKNLTIEQQVKELYLVKRSVMGQPDGTFAQSDTNRQLLQAHLVLSSQLAHLSEARLDS